MTAAGDPVEEVPEVGTRIGTAAGGPGEIGAAAGGPGGGSRPTTLVVDLANLMGSRPDGWWRDRRGAASRLLAGLSLAAGTDVALPGGEPGRLARVIAVVEGRARDVPEVDGVELVRAPGSGDDALAALVGELEPPAACLVVTADRGLRARMPAGVAVTGPGWLRDLLDAQAF